MKRAHTQAKPKRPEPVVLVILDGFGLNGQKDAGSAITKETAPHLFKYFATYPSTQLTAHGSEVGLFPGQAGNSEAGHLNIGAGRVVKQDIVIISEAIADGTFFKNEAFHQGLLRAQEHGGAVHIMGLLTDGDSAHAHPDHVYALLQYFRDKQFTNVYLHIFTDGRDSTPHSAVNYLSDLRERLQPHEQIASVCGRFYAMDRNKMWERTARAYHALVCAEGLSATSAEEAITAAYNRGETDEYIQPTVIVDKSGAPVTTIKDHDTVLFFNARSDRARQLTKAFVQEDFAAQNPGAFTRRCHPRQLTFVAMTDFGPDLPCVLTAFPSPDVPDCLAAAVGEQYRQLYISETEKYAHVTFFINGGYPQPINGEDRELVRSTGHYTYADHPEMSTKAVTKKIIAYLKKNTYNFVVANFPNADMVGHTGDIAAAKKAVQTLDRSVDQLVSCVLEHHGLIAITADHGNAEIMVDASGEMMTEHTTNPVPFILISKELKGRKLSPGRLADVVPTLLSVMGLPQPERMTGYSLLIP